jgi:ABC-type antimicrobial peptide transport system permease subunit
MTTKDQHQTPPRWAKRLLHWYCADHLEEEIQGDLEEEFYFQIKKSGLRKARIDYIRNVIDFIRPFAIKRKKPSTSNPSLNMNMIRHYLLVAARNAVRQKAFSAINIIGLVLGMTCSLFIMLWVKDELAVDNFHLNEKKLFVLYQTTTSGGKMNGTYSTPYRLTYQTLNFKKREEAAAVGIDELKPVIPEMEKMTSYATGYELPWGHAETFQVGEKMQKFDGSRAGKDFFTMLNYPLLAGDAKAALHDISSIAISRKMAEFFFSTPQEAIGKSIRYENKIDFIVNAVFENVSAKSSLSFDFLINWDSQIKQLEWASPYSLTIFQLEESADIAQVENKLNKFLEARMDKNDPEKITVGLFPYGDRYLYSNFENGKPAEGRMAYIRIFTGVAIFILIIACINFMNLATARSIKRAKEVGVRKVVGSSRFSLIYQFFGESILFSAIALLISVATTQVLLPAFNNLTGKEIASPILSPSYWVMLISLALTTGIAAGSYPALYLSSLRPARILKGTLRFANSAIWLRKGLVVFQFTLSIALVIATIVVSSQTHFVQNTNLGYDRDNLVYITIEGEINPKYALFKERALKMPGIAMVDRSSEMPHAMGFVVDETDGLKNTNTGNDAIQWEGKENNSVGFKPASVGYDFLKIMNLKVSEGRDFSHSYATDSAEAFMVNEEAVKQMGMKDPIGKWISAWNKKGHIIGILKDYHTNTLREVIRPLIIDVKEYEYFGVVLVKLEAGKTKEGLASLEAVCKEINPNYPFEFKFLDQEYDKLYRNERVITRLTNIFAMLGIAISCLGLLGLVIFTAEQRTKEIGIRKVLGATVANIVNLLSKEFLSLVMLSFMIAAPVAGYFMNEWLRGFAYRIDLSWWIYGMAGGSALLIALLTISFQAFQSAITNPVKSLRME